MKEWYLNIRIFIINFGDIWAHVWWETETRVRKRQSISLKPIVISLLNSQRARIVVVGKDVL